MKMTRSEFTNNVKQLLTEQGFKKISISTALFRKKADITAKDRYGKKKFLKAELTYRKGKEYIRITDPYRTDWIDRIEAFEAFMDD